MSKLHIPLTICRRWMRMFTIPNQSSLPKAYTQFTDAVETDADADAEGGSRLMPSGNRERVVDCMEEFVKYTIIMRRHFDLFNDRYSERQERAEKARREEQNSRVKEKAGEEGNARSIVGAGVVNGIDVGGI